MDLKSTVNQFNIIKIYPVFTQQQDTNCIQVPRDYKPGNTGTYPGAKRCKIFQNGATKSWSKGMEIIQSVPLSWWNYVRNQYQKIFETNTYFQVQCDIYQERSLT